MEEAEESAGPEILIIDDRLGVGEEFAEVYLYGHIPLVVELLGDIEFHNKGGPSPQVDRATVGQYTRNALNIAVRRPLVNIKMPLYSITTA